MDMRGADKDTQMMSIINRVMSEMNTCLPGRIESFDDATQTATVIPTIQAKVTVGDVVTYVDMPTIVNVLIVFPFAITKGFALTLPISSGDACLLFFSQKAIDNWHMMGGIQPPEQDTPGSRHHSLTDCFAILAPVPLPNVLGAWNSNGIEIRNSNRDVRCTIENNQAVVKAEQSVLTLLTSGVVTCTAATSVTVTTPLVTLDAPSVVCTGNLQVNGGINTLGTYGSSNGLIYTPGDVQDGVRTMAADRLIYNGHTHGGIEPGGDNTDTPNQPE